MTTEITDLNADIQIPGLSKRELKTLQKSFVHRRWLGKYLILKQFVEKFNRLPMQKEQYPKGIRIGSWSHSQRNYYRSGSLPLWRIKLLSSLGFEWGRKRDTWDEMFQKAKSLQEKKNAPLSRYTSNDEERFLKLWLYKQSDDIKKGKLSKKRIKLLNQAGLIVNRLDYRFELFYKNCKEFIKKHGRLPSAHGDEFAERSLGKMRHYQVFRMREGMLTPEKYDKLLELGLADKIIDIAWEEKFLNVSSIVKQKVDSGIIYGKDGIVATLGDGLYVWLRDQRKKYSKNIILTPEQRKLLEDAKLIRTLSDLAALSKDGALNG